MPLHTKLPHHMPMHAPSCLIVLSTMEVSTIKFKSQYNAAFTFYADGGESCVVFRVTVFFGGGSECYAALYGSAPSRAGTYAHVANQSGSSGSTGTQQVQYYSNTIGFKITVG